MALTEILLKSGIPFHEITEEESKRLKLTLLEMYQAIFGVCEKNRLSICMGGGSCLGTVRHKGFIPWDDDLDLNMFRADYEKLPQILQEEYPGKYKIVGPGYSEKTPYNFLKIEKVGTSIKTMWDDKDEHHGVGIDIFPIDTVPKSKLLRLFHGVRLNFIFYAAICTRLYQKPVIAHEYMMRNSEGKKTLRARKIIGFFLSWRKYYKWNELGDKIASKNYKSDFVTIPTGRKHFFGELHKRDVFLPYKKSIFENAECYLPNKSDEYLTSLYGDYMQIPPPEKREKHFIIELDFGDRK